MSTKIESIISDGAIPCDHDVVVQALPIRCPDGVLAIDMEPEDAGIPAYTFGAHEAVSVIQDIAAAMGLSVRLTRPFHPFDMRGFRAPVGPIVGRLREAAHMRGFLAWCRSEGACSEGLAFVSARSSPEQAMRDAAASERSGEQMYCIWLAERLTHDQWAGWMWQARHDAAPRYQKTVAEWLASPEWAAAVRMWTRFRAPKPRAEELAW